jgi:hypothetical protein
MMTFEVYARPLDARYFSRAAEVHADTVKEAAEIAARRITRRHGARLLLRNVLTNTITEWTTVTEAHPIATGQALVEA